MLIRRPLCAQRIGDDRVFDLGRLRRLDVGLGDGLRCALTRDVEQDAGRDRVHEQRRAAEAEEREREALGRQDGERDREVHQRLRAEHRGDAEREIGAVVVGRAERRTYAARGEREVHDAEREDADEAELLADDRSDEVVVRLGQVERLQALAETGAPGASGAEGHDALERLVREVRAVLIHVLPGEERSIRYCFDMIETAPNAPPRIDAPRM